MPKSSYEEFISDPKRRKMFEKESLSLEAMELICILMAKAKVSRSELARREGVTKACVTYLLQDRGRSIGIKKLASIAYSLGYRVKLSYEKLEKIKA